MHCLFELSVIFGTRGKENLLFQWFLLFYFEFSLQYMSVFILLLHLCSVFSGSQIMFSFLVYVSYICSNIFVICILILCLYFTLNFIAGQYADILYVMCAKHYHEVNTRVPMNKRKKLKRSPFCYVFEWAYFMI